MISASVLCQRPSAGGAIQAGRLADLAVASLLDEAELTPKPGLVDRRGSGAHWDLDLERMCRSARSLRPGFMEIARVSYQQRPTRALRECVGQIGRDCERAMLAATGGSNAHRGAIWTMGLILAGAAMRGRGASAASIAAAAASLARLADVRSPASPELSNGRRAYARFGVRGARGEACDGFPHVIELGLPALRAARARPVSKQAARLNALMAIMTQLDDTCLLHRGGLPALLAAQAGARSVLEAGGSSTAAGQSGLSRLEAELLKRGASPGGAADLLAATIFLDRLELEEFYGTTEV